MIKLCDKDCFDQLQMMILRDANCGATSDVKVADFQRPRILASRFGMLRSFLQIACNRGHLSIIALGQCL